MDKKKHLSITFTKDLHYKLYYIADYEGRSGSRQILYLINKCIREFEKEHGEIEVPKE